VVTPDGTRAASVLVRGGRIAAVWPADAAPAGTPVADHGDAVVMPGLVDTHVHVNEPGRTDWEGFESGTRAAAAGGVTTILDMPLNSVPPTTSAAGLRVKREAALGQCYVDVGFWGGLVPGNLLELAPLMEQGIFGFKAFLSPSGVPEFDAMSPEQLRASLAHVAPRGVPVLVHAELGMLLREPEGAAPAPYAAYLASRPAGAEREAVSIVGRLCRETGGRAHIVHVSACEVIPEVLRARREGARLTAETCPHYLFFAAEDVPPGATEFKCAPPIREASNRSRLWEGLENGALSMVVSDHSPAPPSTKCRDSGDFRRAWGGIASLELSLKAVWTAARARGVSFERLAEWLSAAPARLAGLGKRKGAIAAGKDADFVIWRPEQSAEVDPSALQQRHKLTPYAGQMLDGVVEATYLRGEKIFEGGKFLARPRGQLLVRGEAA
jgi:allantoinase